MTGQDKGEVKSPRPRGRPKGSRNKTTAANDKASPRSKLKEQKQNFVQEEILHAAAALIAARGFRAVTIDDISASLGFTKSVIYYYLKSKNDILWRIFSRMYESYFESLSAIIDGPDGPGPKMERIVRQHALNVMKNRDWTAIYFREESELNDKQRRQITIKKRQYDSAIESVYKEGVKQGLFRDIPPHIAVTSILGSCNWISTWYNPEGPTSAEDIAEHYVTLLTSGFRLAAA